MLPAPGKSWHRSLSLDRREKTEPRLQSFSPEMVHQIHDPTRTYCHFRESRCDCAGLPRRLGRGPAKRV